MEVSIILRTQRLARGEVQNIVLRCFKEVLMMICVSCIVIAHMDFVIVAVVLNLLVIFEVLDNEVVITIVLTWVHHEVSLLVHNGLISSCQTFVLFSDFDEALKKCFLLLFQSKLVFGSLFL